MIPMNLRILKIMEEKGISIEGLKNRIETNGEKLSRTSISNIINNKTSPRIDTLNTIAKALDVELVNLFQEDSVLGILLVNGEEHSVRSKADLKALLKKIE